MRRHLLAGLAVTLLALIESSLLPAALGPLLRPNLVLIASSTWAAIRGDEGFLWAAGGGLILDVLSGSPFGMHTAGLVLGNTVAVWLDRVPIPVPGLRVINWVAVTTVVYYAVSLIVLAFSGRPVDVAAGITNIALPSLIINGVLSIPAYVVLNRLQARLREQERFLPER